MFVCPCNADHMALLPSLFLPIDHDMCLSEPLTLATHVLQATSIPASGLFMGCILLYKKDKTIMPPPSRPSPPAPANASPVTIITTPSRAPCSNSSCKHSLGKNSSSATSYTCDISTNYTASSNLFPYESDMRTNATFLYFSISLALRVVSLSLAFAMFVPDLVTWNTAKPKNYEQVRIHVLIHCGSSILVSYCSRGQWEFDETDADIYICGCPMELISHWLSGCHTFSGYSQILGTCYSTGPNRGNDLRRGICRCSLSICKERTTSTIGGHP